MRPVRQGDLDALCGLYAIINAIELTGARGPRTAMHKELFRRLTIELPSDVMQSAMTDGLNAHDLMTASAKALRWLGRRHSLQLSLDQPWPDAGDIDASMFVEILRGEIIRPRRAFILNIKTPNGWHWTVARKLGRETLLVRDSGNLGQLRLERFIGPNRAYQIDAKNTLRLTRRLRV